MSSMYGRKKGQEPDAPYEADDSLRTTTTANILDLLSEGEIEGLVDGPASIYFDDTPLAIPDSSEPDGYKYNFQGVKWAFRPGTLDQTSIPGFATAAAEITVGVEVKQSQPVIRSIIDQNVDSVAVRIGGSSFRKVDDQGNVYGSSATLKVWLRANDDADYVEKATIPISGKSSTSFEKAVTINLHGQGPWELKVTRETPDADQYNQNQTVLNGYTEIIGARFRYPYCALLALQFDAAYFSSVPTRSYETKLLKVKVPINRMYDAATDTVTYLGPWDGRLKSGREWTDNPAWCLYDMLTSERYGLGQWLKDGSETLVNLAAIYQFGQYCDEIVNGRRRLSCNVYFQTQLDAYDLINQLASVMRGMTMWNSGWVDFCQDSPSDPEYLFSNANVENGIFNYSSNERRSRYTAAYVYWTDPEQGYRQVAEYVEDRAAITRYGYNPTNVTAIGCTNRAQAIEFGKWLIYGACYEPGVVNFTTDMSAVFLKPGSVVEVQDTYRAGRRIAGRVRAVPGTYEVTLDQDFPLDAGQDYTLHLVYPTKDTGQPKVYTAQITSPPGVYRTIKHIGGFPSLPEPGMIFFISSVALQPAIYRVTGIKELDPGKYQVTATEQNPGKYDFIEKKIPLPIRITTASVRPAAPVGLRAIDELYLDPASVKVMLRLDFTSDSTSSGNFARIRHENGAWQTYGPYPADYIEILDVLEGQYDIEVWSRNVLGLESAHTALSYNVLGKQRPPTDTAILDVVLQAAGLLVTLRPVPDLDFDVLEVRWATGNVGWEGAALLDRVKGASALLTQAHGLGTTFWFYARSLDTSGNYSTGTAVYEYQANLPSPPRYVTAVANLGYIDMHWEAGERANYYEVRAGLQWETGELIGQTIDLAYTFEWARPGATVFWVESYDALGNPSGRPAAVNKDIAKTSGRNVVYEVDFASEAWPGRLLNLVNSGTTLDIAISRFYGEYISRFSIDESHRVLLAMDGSVAASSTDLTTWEDMAFPWDDPQADIPWWKPGEVSQVDVSYFGAVDTDEEDAHLLEDWTFEDTLEGTTTDGTMAGTPAYAPGIFDTNGISLRPVEHVDVPRGTPAVFSYHWWLIVSQARNSRLLRLEGTDGTYLTVEYDAARKMLTARRSEGEQMELALTLAEDDFVFLGLSQAAGELRFFAQKPGIPYRYASIAVADAHGYDTITLN